MVVHVFSYAAREMMFRSAAGNSGIVGDLNAQELVRYLKRRPWAAQPKRQAAFWARNSSTAASRESSTR